MHTPFWPFTAPSTAAYEPLSVELEPIMSVEPKRSNSDDEESKKEAPTAFVGNSATITSMPDLVTITEDEFNQLTLYEKKATLINQEMDKMGFGR